MRAFVLLLILANLGLVVYFNQDLILPSVPELKQTEIHPEKISVLNEAQIKQLPKKVSETPPPTQVASSCYEWGVFSSASLKDAQSAIAKLPLQATVKEQTSKDAKRFWVYRPPLKSTEEAQAKAEELRALGVEDLFVVQEPKWKNAISFGVFEDEQLAIKLLTELKEKGVKDAVKALRNQGKGNASLVFKNLIASEASELKKLKPEFPAANLKEVSCN